MSLLVVHTCFLDGTVSVRNDETVSFRPDNDLVPPSCEDMPSFASFLALSHAHTPLISMSLEPERLETSCLSAHHHIDKRGCSGTPRDSFFAHLLVHNSLHMRASSRVLSRLLKVRCSKMNA